MKAAELERFITDFFQIMRQASSDLETAIEAEQYPNSAIQDLLHVVELGPSQIDAEELKWKLHELRVQRRDAKKELEVTQLWADWCAANKKQMDQLNNILGQMRKILRRQPHDFYIYKTDVHGDAGSHLLADKEPTYEQLKLEGF